MAPWLRIQFWLNWAVDIAAGRGGRHLLASAQAAVSRLPHHAELHHMD